MENINIEKSEVYAFFSEQIHKILGGETTIIGFNQDKHIIRANWIGQAVDGYPGMLGQNAIIRPQHYETYKYLGRVDINHLRFPFRHRALPIKILQI